MTYSAGLHRIFGKLTWNIPEVGMAYSGGPRFEFWPGHWLSLLKLSLAVLNSDKQIPQSKSFMSRLLPSPISIVTAVNNASDVTSYILETESFGK
jgi:hypothetical protein